MAQPEKNSLVTFLNQHDDKAWAEVLTALAPSTHEVDRDAARIWFSFYPLVLVRALESSPDPDRLARKLALQGRYRLADQLDTSHTFLYGHRFWPAAHAAVIEAAKTGDTGVPLKELVMEIAGRVADRAKIEKALAVGITAVGLMTLQHVGLEAFAAAEGKVHLDRSAIGRSAAEVIAERKRERSGGLFGFLRTVDRRWKVRFDENNAECTFEAINGQDLASAGSTDTRDYASHDVRCVEGPIPVECRTAACGTCWVGVLGGADRLSVVDDREWRKMKEFGYLDTDEVQPAVRLACRAKAQGSVTIVVPPWNGVFGKLVEGKLVDEPAPVESSE